MPTFAQDLNYTLAGISLVGAIDQMLNYGQTGQPVTPQVVEALIQNPLYLLQLSGLPISAAKVTALAGAIAALFVPDAPSSGLSVVPPQA